MKLLKGEKLILRMKPIKKLKSYWITKDIIIALIMSFLGAMFFSASSAALAIETLKSKTFTFTHGVYIFFITFILLFLIQIIIRIIINNLHYKKLHFLITNKRLIVRRGLIGHSHSSVLLERIGEITIVQTYLQRLFGIKTMVLEILGTGRRSEVLPAFPNTEENKQLLLELITKKRKAEKLTY